MTKPDNIILEGVVGSTAYGLATPSSDVDIKGVYVAPIREVLGLRGPQAVSETKDHTDPDWSYHELGKFVSLALKCNPTILEILFLGQYLQLSPLAHNLLQYRRSCLSEPAIRGAYGAYAKAQAERLMRRNEDGKEGFDSSVKNRTAKHGRHCMRLLLQGSQLLSTGSMAVHVGDHRDWLFEMGQLAFEDPARFYTEYQAKAEQFDAIESVLPRQPGRERINSVLINLRLEMAGL